MMSCLVTEMVHDSPMPKASGEKFKKLFPVAVLIISTKDVNPDEGLSVSKLR